MSITIRSSVFLILAATVAGCVMGTDFSRASSIESPYGPDAKAMVERAARNSEYAVYEGEVFEVRPGGVVLLSRTGKLLFVAWHLARISVPGLGVSTWDAPPVPKDYQLLRLTSRHPYGLTPEQLQVILTALKQDAILEVKR